MIINIINQSGNAQKISEFVDTHSAPLRNAFLTFLSGAFYITFLPSPFPKLLLPQSEIK